MFDYSNCCRACLSNQDEGLVCLFQEKNEQFRILLSECTNLDVNEIKDMPDHICSSCQQFLLQFNDFRTKCHEVDLLLKRKSYGDHNYSTSGIETEPVEDISSQNSPAARKEKCKPKKKRPKKLKQSNEKNLHKRKKKKNATRPNCNDFSESGNKSKYIEVEIIPVRKKKERKPYVCEVCGYSAQDKTTLRVHTRFHTGEKPFQCSLCPKAFAIVTNLKAHIRTHSGERRFVCECCGRALTTVTALRGHARTHSGEKPYSCKVCSRKFASASNLRQHCRVHTGEKPFKCTVCDKCFASSSDARAHTRTHTGERPHACPICPRRFALASNLKAHARTHAGAARSILPKHVPKVLETEKRLPKEKSNKNVTKTHMCDCGKSYVHKSSLMVHKRSHEKIPDAVPETPQDPETPPAPETPPVPETPAPEILVLPIESEPQTVTNDMLNHVNNISGPNQIIQIPRSTVTFVQLQGTQQLVPVCNPSIATVLPLTLLPVSILR